MRNHKRVKRAVGGWRNGIRGTSRSSAKASAKSHALSAGFIQV